MTDNCLLFLSSSGEISAYSLPDLKCQMKVTATFLLMMMAVILMELMKVAAVRSDNHVGISSFVFSNTGRGLYMSTCNELQEIRLVNVILVRLTIYWLNKNFQFPSSAFSVAAADGCSSPGGRVPVRVVRGPGDG